MSISKGGENMQNKYKHITESITAIVCPLSQSLNNNENLKYKLAFVDRKTFEMLLQDRSSCWRAVYKDNKLQVYGTFKGKYSRLARVIANVENDKSNCSVYIATNDEFDLRTDNLVVDLKGKHKDRTLNEKLEKIRLALPKLPFVKIDEEGKPALAVSDKFESSTDNTTVELNTILSRFKLTTSKIVTIELPTGKTQNFQVKNRDEEELILKVMDFVTSNLA